MKIITTKRSYSQKQILKHRLMKYGFLLIILIIAFILLKLSIGSIIKDLKIFDGNSFLILFSMTLGILLSFLVIWISKGLDKIIDNFDYNIGIAMAGDKGEKMVFNELKKILDDSYSVYPNYIIPGHKFDLDFLIVGPKGLIVVEVKNFSNSTRFCEDKALSIKESGFKQEVTRLIGSSDPRNKMVVHCEALNNYLNYLKLDNINIRKVLVFTKDHVTIEGKSKIYVVKKIYELSKYFESLYIDNKFTSGFCTEINNKLI